MTQLEFRYQRRFFEDLLYPGHAVGTRSPREALGYCTTEEDGWVDFLKMKMHRG